MSDMKNLRKSIEHVVVSISDARCPCDIKIPLIDVISIAVISLLCGYDNIEDIHLRNVDYLIIHSFLRKSRFHGQYDRSVFFFGRLSSAFSLLAKCRCSLTFMPPSLSVERIV